MAIWNLITTNPDAAFGVITTVLGLFGLDRWRRHVRASTLAEVDEWTNVAIGGVAILIEAGALRSHAEAVDRFLSRLRQLAGAVGVTITPDHEARALAKAHAALVKLGQTKLAHELEKLRGPIEALLDTIAKIDKLPAKAVAP
jgi:hypothetical protein